MKLIIIGTSTTAKSIYYFIARYKLYDVIGFAVDKKYKTGSKFCDLPVYDIEDLNPNSDYRLFVALQWNRLNSDRKKLYEKLKKRDFEFVNIISPNAIVNGKIEGKNCWIADMAVLDFGSKIQNNVFVKVGAYIGPNVIIKDHCFIGAKSIIGGASVIGKQTFIGINASIFDTVEIGDMCIVGACSVVKRNLPNYTKCVILVDSIKMTTYNEEIIEEKLKFNRNVR